MIESIALWHISQAQTRKSNRTISFMGAGHANPKKAFSGSHSLEGLVDYLKNIGYVSLASLDVDKQIKDTKLVDHATQEIELDKIIQQTSNFIIDWVKKSDTEVQEILAQGECPISPAFKNQQLINKQFFSQTTPKTSNSKNNDKMGHSKEFDSSNNNRDQLQTADQNDNTSEKIPYNDILQEQSTYTPWSWCTLL